MFDILIEFFVRLGLSCTRASACAFRIYIVIEFFFVRLGLSVRVLLRASFGYRD